MATNGDAERVLVTGASGYLATHIIQQLQEAGHRVRGSVRNLEDEEKIKHLKTLNPEATHEVELVKAELQDADSWKSAVEGCTYVIHVASPFPFSAPRNEDDVIKPAVEGVTNVLKACVDAKTIKRVVMTSAGLAVCGTMKGGEVSEKDWPETDKLDPYAKSKTLAEKAAWDFVKELKDEEKFEFVVLNPVMMVGPILHNAKGTSVEVIKRLLERNPMFLPKMNLPMVDVRDAAAAHVKALTIKEADGNRHILSTQNLWWSEMAATLSAEFKSQGYKLPTMGVPKAAVSMASVFKRDAKAVLPIWNKVTTFDNTRMKEVLLITEPRDVKTAIIEMAYSIIEAGFAKRTKKYRGPHVKGEANGPTENGDVKEDGKATEDGDVVPLEEGEDATGKEKEDGDETAAAEGEATTEEVAKKEEAAEEAPEEAPEENEKAEVASESQEVNPTADTVEGENKTDEIKESEKDTEATEKKPEDAAKENGIDSEEEVIEKKGEVAEVNGEVDGSGDAVAAE